MIWIFSVILLAWLLPGLGDPWSPLKSPGSLLREKSAVPLEKEEDWASLRPGNMSWEQPSAEAKFGWLELQMDEIDGQTSADTVLSIREEMNQFLEGNATGQKSVYRADPKYEMADARYYSTGIPVYVSLTTISSRISRVAYSIKALLKGTVRPNRIYLMVSEDSFLLDKGTKREKLPRDLVNLKAAFPDVVHIVFVKNYGPHRKLLPMLAKFWKEDVLLITVDDDNNRSQTERSATVANLLRYFRRSKGTSVVALRVRRIGLCDEVPHKIMSYRRYWGGATPGREEQLLLPTGTGGVLYRPRFFHPVVFSDKLRELTKVGDDLTFRIACMAGGTPVLTGCDKRTHGRCPIKDTDIHISVEGLQEKRSMMRNWKKLLLEGFKKPDESKDKNITDEEERLNKTRYIENNLQLMKTLLDNVQSMDGASEEIVGKKSTVDRGRRRLADDKKSLYMVFNRFQANDMAWNKAAEFLGKSLVFDFKAKTAEWVRKEREACFEEYWKKSKTKKYVRYLLEERMPNGTILMREPFLAMPPRTMSCMVYKCPTRNRIQRLRVRDVDRSDPSEDVDRLDSSEDERS